MIHQDAAHDIGSEGEEVRAVAPVDGALIHQPDKGLVNQSSSLNGVVGSLPPQVPRGHRAQLVVKQRSQLGEGCLIAAAPLQEKLRDGTIRLHTG